MNEININVIEKAAETINEMYKVAEISMDQEGYLNPYIFGDIQFLDYGINNLDKIRDASRPLLDDGLEFSTKQSNVPDRFK